MLKFENLSEDKFQKLSEEEQNNVLGGKFDNEGATAADFTKYSDGSWAKDGEAQWDN
ncbi:hypothetical protein LJ737_09485 [Hymenobacter sp. 15J16-1T3B]|uniref:hypothetical protein n=1 Tax=Hymenobacter sp. 15J16-1T3B TaxID=2886941 RepID=UPI001D0FDBE8|nr:hypothetical protein [Hymenobacter sp. 15J16-1T3B]MCC3157471.1 hypothetical protein [Hymenobacter sp. 15J16-1T3B]